MEYHNSISLKGQVKSDRQIKMLRMSALKSSQIQAIDQFETIFL